MTLVPYCGIRNPPKNRVRGTSQQCINSGQARYYGIMSVENEINRILADKKKLANEKAKTRRQNGKFHIRIQFFVHSKSLLFVLITMTGSSIA